ncbi:MAG: hypothetical protein FWD37_04685, partial [Methanomassiliicoccaceae archaeon]|nr:hypothetical protein [Methanomassiliicoccaceae archaeon]
VWVGGITYYVEKGGDPIEFKRPIANLETIREEKNQNYRTILNYLYESLDHLESMKNIGDMMMGKNDKKSRYIPVRNGNKEKRTVSRKMITDWVKKLESWGLVSLEQKDGRSKNVKLTQEGRFTVNFFNG